MNGTKILIINRKSEYKTRFFKNIKSVSQLLNDYNIHKNEFIFLR